MTREVIFHVGVDYFDMLPDDVLIPILERLNLNDAVKTSILSRRLLGLWELLLPYRKILDFRGLPTGSKKFKEFVNGVMRGHKGPTVDTLTIAISEPCESFDNWVAFARTKCVKNLEIEGLDYTDFVPCCTGFSVVWDKLTSLTLRSVLLRRGDLEGVLKNVLINLESLSLEHAVFLKALTVSSRSLKRLEFSHCRSLLRVGIFFAPNLQFYRRMDGNTWRSNELRIKRDQAPKLSHVCLDAGFIQYHLPQLYYTKVEKLELDVGECVERHAHDRYPRLRNLKELILRFEIKPWSCFFYVILRLLLPACPQLQKLTLYYCHSPGELFAHTSSDWRKLKRAQLDARSRVHQCLKEVEFCGWSGREDELEAANLVKKIAPNLEKITCGLGAEIENMYGVTDI